MMTYREYRPTRFDCAGLGCDDRQDWLVSPCGTNRDADTLTRSNYRVVCRELDAIDPEGTDHEEHEFGHWACGWFRIVLVRPGSACARAAGEWEDCLADYPVASDEDYGELEFEEICACWKSMSLRDRVWLCQRTQTSVFAARRDAVPERCYDRLRDDGCA